MLMDTFLFISSQHVSQGSPVRHSRAQNTVAPTSALTTSSGGSSASSIVNIFEGHRFVVSGIPEKLK